MVVVDTERHVFAVVMDFLHREWSRDQRLVFEDYIFRGKLAH